VTELGLWMQWDYGDGPEGGRPGDGVVLRLAGWSRFRVIVPLWDRTMPSVVMALDRALRRFGGAPTYALTDNERLRRSPAMRDPRMVAVGLDVHKSSVRLAAMCGGEVLRDVTLTFDHAAVSTSITIRSGRTPSSHTRARARPRRAPPRGSSPSDGALTSAIGRDGGEGARERVDAQSRAAPRACGAVRRGGRTPPPGLRRRRSW
jgi:hypothetical protein